MKNIPKKNYFIYVFLVIITVVFVLCGKKWYENKKYEENIKRMNDILEVKQEGLSDYLMENQNVILYLSSSKDQNLSEFEKEFMEYINNKNINKKFTYIDLSQVNGNFDKEIKDNLNLKNLNIDFSKFSNIIIIDEGIVVDVLYKQVKIINIDDVKLFLEGYEQ